MIANNDDLPGHARVGEVKGLFGIGGAFCQVSLFQIVKEPGKRNEILVLIPLFIRGFSVQVRRFSTNHGHHVRHRSAFPPEKGSRDRFMRRILLFMRQTSSLCGNFESPASKAKAMKRMENKKPADHIKSAGYS